MHNLKELLIASALSRGYSQERAKYLATLYLDRGGLGGLFKEPEEFSFFTGRDNFLDVIQEVEKG